MDNRFFQLTARMALLLLLFAAAGCGGRNDIEGKLDLADSLMASKPDSALKVLARIDSSRLDSRRVAARYALLKSMALDKNYVDTTTFDVLQPTIDYYLKKGTPDERLRTYYYQGRIYQNQGDDDAAMRSFMNASELGGRVADTLLLAHSLVAQATLYFKQYKTSEFVHTNMEAARLYGAIGKPLPEIKSYTNALDGYVILDDKQAADSLLAVCVALVRKNPEGEKYLFPSLLAYTVELCPPRDIKAFLDEYRDLELTTDETIYFAQGFSEIGEYAKALSLLSQVSPSALTLDSLKYASVKISVLEKMGKYEQAFNLYKDYSAMLERHQSELITKDLLFSDKKHQLEKDSLIEIQHRDRIIWGALSALFCLVMLVGWLYYRGYLSRTKRILAEKENENLMLEQDNLRKEKEKAELERDKKTLEAANLRLEISQLEGERDHLRLLQRQQSELAGPIKDVIKVRLDMLNGLLAKEISNNDSYAEPYNKWIETVHNDKKKFMDSTRLAFAASHPKLMSYLEQHGLSTDELNYLCLYAIGLRGKEVGEYIQIKRHYIISHEIRKKLGINEHETNIGLYIRRLMKTSENQIPSFP